MSDSLSATTITIAGNGGDEIEAYIARPSEDTKRGGVVVIHHFPGYDRSSKEIVRRFAELGYDAIMPNLYTREAPHVPLEEVMAFMAQKGGVPDSQLIGDVAGAAAALRELPSSNGKAGCIGYCSGGRQSVLAACNVDLDAAVDCYGGSLVSDSPPESPLKMKNITDQLPNLRCPLLGLFGNDDQNPSPENVDTLEKLLDENGKTYELHRYDGAGHGFFSVDRPSYRPDAANDGWERIADFYGKYLGVG